MAAKRIKEKLKPFTVRLPQNVRNALEAKAEADRLELSVFVRRLLWNAADPIPARSEVGEVSKPAIAE